VASNTKGTKDNVIAYCLSPEGDSFANDKWDFGFLKEAFDRNNVEIIQCNSLPDSDRAFVVAPGYEWSNRERSLNKQLKKVKRVILFITADELGVFDVTQVKHPSIEIWIQYPYPRDLAYHKLPTGSPEHITKLGIEYPQKTLDLYFAGQITHQRRVQLAEALPKLENAEYLLTQGFTQGDVPKDYYAKLSRAKFAAAPAGTATIDSFRFYEALEMLCLPIADQISARGSAYGFWEILFGSMPVEQISDWNNLPKVIEELKKEYPANMHRAVAWWIKYKRDFAYKIMEQINEH
jgi:hypothetical protein